MWGRLAVRESRVSSERPNEERREKPVILASVLTLSPEWYIVRPRKLALSSLPHPVHVTGLNLDSGHSIPAVDGQRVNPLAKSSRRVQAQGNPRQIGSRPEPSATDLFDSADDDIERNYVKMAVSSGPGMWLRIRDIPAYVEKRREIGTQIFSENPCRMSQIAEKSGKTREKTSRSPLHNIRRISYIQKFIKWVAGMCRGFKGLRIMAWDEA